MDQDILDTYESLYGRIRDITDYKVRRDLQKMYKTCETLKRELSQEQESSVKLIRETGRSLKRQLAEVPIGCLREIGNSLFGKLNLDARFLRH